MAKTIPTTYSLGHNSYLYAEPAGELKSQINGVYSLSIIFFILCTVTISMRVYVRAVMLKNLCMDDWLFVLTLVSHFGSNMDVRNYANNTQVIFLGYVVLLCVICAELLDNVVEYAAGEVPTTLGIPRVRGHYFLV